MIVVNYNTSDDHGGAAKAANRLNAALSDAGVHAFMACRHKNTRDENSTRIIERRSEIAPRLSGFETFWRESAREYLIAENRTPLSSTIFSVDPFGLDVTEAPIVNAARVHHLHWCASFISPSSLLRLRRTGKPVFVTLHDQWWMTGGCHYSAGCAAYETGCAQCPQLRADPAGLVAAAFAEKKAIYGDGAFTVIAPSKWMADCAARSDIFRHADIHVVRNPFALDVFRPLPAERRNDFRASIGLEDGDIAILFGAQKVSDRRKGGAVLIEALKRVPRSADRKIVLVTFGNAGAHSLDATGIPAIELGEIFDETRLAEVYASADLFLAPSLEDNYPNTVVESLACGTPVIGFAAGGMTDLVDGEVTGLLAEPVGDAAALAEAIVAGLEKFAGRENVRAQCRARIEAPHDKKTIAAQMISLYESKAPDFHADLTRLETLIVRETKQRNRAGKAAFAKLDISAALFDNEKLLTVLAPLQAIHEKSLAARAQAVKDADLTVELGRSHLCGRGQHGERYLGAGWSAPYRDGVWNAQTVTHLHFFLKDGERMNAVALDVSAPANGGETLAVDFNHQPAGAVRLSGGERQKLSIPLPEAAGPCYVNLRISLPPAAGATDAGAPAPAKRLFLTALCATYEPRLNEKAPSVGIRKSARAVKDLARRLAGKTIPQIP